MPARVRVADERPRERAKVEPLPEPTVYDVRLSRPITIDDHHQLPQDSVVAELQVNYGLSMHWVAKLSNLVYATPQEDGPPMLDDEPKKLESSEQSTDEE